MRRRALRVLWPAFLMACVLELVVFSVVDPQQLHDWSGMPVGWSSPAVYSIAFGVFWAVCAASSLLSLNLMRPPSSINRAPRF